jgi:peptide/nickel transport system substrate-binding protein
MFGLEKEQPEGFAFDPRRAIALLEQSGWKVGSDGVRVKGSERLELTVVSAFPNASSVKPIPELLERMFRTVGIELRIAEVEDNQLYYSGYADSGKADLFMEFAANANSDPTFLLYNLFHRTSPWPSTRFHAPGSEVDERIDAARAGVERAVTLKVIAEAHRKIVDSHVAAIPILLVPAMVLTRPDIRIDTFENLDWMNFGEARRVS